MFDSLVEDMDTAIMASLSDGAADYLDAGGSLVASGVEVMIDREVQHAGPDGLFMVIPIGITWRKTQLASVARGGRFIVGTATYTIEDTIADDGHMITAACMEAP